MRAWKLLGVAGLAGVAATGVIIARDERRRRQVTPDELRDRLRSRYQEVDQAADEGAERDDAGSTPKGQTDGWAGGAPGR